MEFSCTEKSIRGIWKGSGNIRFLFNVLRDDVIRTLDDKEWYPEALYLLAMTDYISRLNYPSVLNQDNTDQILDMLKSRLDSDE